VACAAGAAGVGAAAGASLFTSTTSLEATGALIGLGGSIAEGIGEEKAGDVSKGEAEEDITSQVRSQSLAQGIEQAVGRTQ